MNYSAETYQKAICALDALKDNCPKSEQHTIDFILDALREKAENDRLREDGRLVVLPCAVGDAVKVDARTWGNSWQYKTVEYGKFLVGEIVSITKTKRQTLMKIRVEHNVSWRRPMKRYPVSAIGITVFLTREEAEKALEGLK